MNFKRFLIILISFSFALSVYAQKINPNQIEWRIPVVGDITADSFSGTPAPVGVTGVSLEAINESIKSIVSGTITAMTVYERNKDDVFSPDDVRKNWWKKADTSWFQELGEFPERVLIVGADSLYIIDLDSQSVYMEYPMTISVEKLGGYSTNADNPRTGIFMKNGILFVATYDEGLYFVDYYNDNGGYHTSANAVKQLSNITNRASASAYIVIAGGYGIKSNKCNSIHANVVNGTLYAVVGTDGGLSQINMDTGVVYDNTDSATNKKINRVKLSADGLIYFSCQDSATETEYQKLYRRVLLNADNTSGYDNNSTEYSLVSGTPAGLPLDNATGEIYSLDLAEKGSLSEVGQHKIILGKDTKLTILHENSTPTSGYYQYITKTYNTGLLYKDTALVGNYLNGSDSVIADRSYRGNTLTNEGSVAMTADATAPFGVSAGFNGIDEYLSSESTDFNFTDEVFVSFWFKCSNLASGDTFLSKYQDSNRSYVLQKDTAGNLVMYLSVDGTAEYRCTFSGAFTQITSYDYFAFSYKGGSHARFYKNGVIQTCTSAGSLPASLYGSTSPLLIGVADFSGLSSYLGGRLSQLKLFNEIPENESDFVKYDYELGRNTIGKTCTLQGNSAQVNSVSAFGDKILLSTGDGSNTGYIQTISGGAVAETIEATTNANNLVLASADYTIYSSNLASGLQVVRPAIDFLSYVQQFAYKPQETIFVKGSWASGGASITITNPYITANSNIIAMPLSAPEGSWYLSGQAEGTVTINSLSTEAYSVNYLLMINNQ
jgi:hypothetical protein